MLFPKINILIILFFLMGYSNAMSKDMKEKSNNIELFADNYTVKIKSCSLKIPLRYKLIEFSYHKPNALDKRVNPNNNFSYKIISFFHKDVDSEDKFSIKNLILYHSIKISNHNFSNINILTSKLQLVSSKKILGIKVLRYKLKKLNIDKTNPLQLKNNKLYKLNNTIIVNEKNFAIIINETDEYIDEIYKMIRNCASMIDKKNKEK